jgi:hypothetical protein
LDKCPFCRYGFEPDIKVVIQEHLVRYPRQTYEYWFRGIATWIDATLIRLFGFLLFACIVYYCSEIIRGIVDARKVVA